MKRFELAIKIVLIILIVSIYWGLEFFIKWIDLILELGLDPKDLRLASIFIFAGEILMCVINDDEK